MTEQILKLYADGKSQRAIARELGISQSKVARLTRTINRRDGLSRREPPNRRRAPDLPKNLREVLEAAAWIALPENEDGIFWPAAIWGYVERDADDELDCLVARGLIRREYGANCVRETAYSVTEVGLLLLRS